MSAQAAHKLKRIIEMARACWGRRPALVSLPAAVSARVVLPRPCAATFAAPFSTTPLRRLHTSCVSLQEPSSAHAGLPIANFVEEIRSSLALPLPRGAIELVIGPMFAGKTSELLRRVEAYEAQGLNVAIVKSDKDDRYLASHVVTHDGVKKPCFAVPSLSTFRETAAAAYAACDVIAVDEAQFFPDLAEFCAAAADEDHKRLILAGLDGDFQRRRFGQMLDLVPMADQVTKLTALCLHCQQEAAEESIVNGGNEGRTSSVFPAVFTARLAAGTEQELVGGAEKYAPVCRRHYMQLITLQKQE